RRRSRAARSSGDTARQAGKAAFARATTSSTSAAPARGTSAITCSVAGSTTSITGENLAAFEHPAALVVGDDLVEQPLFGSSVVQVVAPHRITEGFARELAPLPEINGLAKRGGERIRLRLG